MWKVFPGLNLSTAQPVSPIMGSGKYETGSLEAFVIDISGSTQKSAPLIIAGSDFQ